MKKIPPWTEEDARLSHEASDIDPELRVERARYAKAIPEIRFEDSVELQEGKAQVGSLLMLARDIEAAVSIPEWVSMASAYYPSNPLTKSNAISADARHVFLRGAIGRLLHLVGAPSSAISDFQGHWGERRAAHSDLRAEAAKALLEDPTLSYRELKEISGYDPSSAHADVKAGLLRKRS